MANQPSDVSGNHLKPLRRIPNMHFICRAKKGKAMDLRKIKKTD
ncbi:hypothetical protein NEISUBOT_05479 [Neisseria subflava NJ9703]|uniref:Uncharacterized protein n=1 Tax=Neisseria subflava NJ9703 TaxID=546268 RepID=A0A9W5IPA4_NEISU|nr:hypothetical protein NEISUBOT_05479 [Neisseria subflava NJ9703]